METNLTQSPSSATSVTDPRPLAAKKSHNTIRNHAIVVIDEGEHGVKIEFRRGGAAVAETHALTPAIAQALRPETLEMVREISPRHHVTNRPGLFWFSSVGHFVAHESRLEAASLLLLDFEAETQAVVSQPFRLHLARSSSPRDHVPDYFLRLRSGQGVVVDVKPRAHLDKPKVRAQFAATREICDQAGWQYRIMTEPTDNSRRNLSLVSNFRRPPVHTDVVFPEALTLAGLQGVTWGELVKHVSTETRLHHALVLPCLFHAVWSRELSVDLDCPFDSSSVVSLGDRA
jgi:hypothetical protein